MKNDRLEVIAPDRKRHAEELYDLLWKAFPYEEYYGFLDRCRWGYIGGSHYDWNSSRIGILNGRIVTHWGVWDFRMRIGVARVRVGGIGVVATDARHRKRGLMNRTADNALGAMRSAGYDMSLLFGIDEFYHRFGYVRA